MLQVFIPIICVTALFCSFGSTFALFNPMERRHLRFSFWNWSFRWEVGSSEHLDYVLHFDGCSEGRVWLFFRIYSGFEVDGGYFRWVESAASLWNVI